METNSATSTPVAAGSAVDQNKVFDDLVQSRLTKYGATETFNAALTLVAIVNTCSDLDQSLQNVDKAVEVLERNPWVTGIIEVAFHLKAYKIIKIEILDEPSESKPRTGIAWEKRKQRVSEGFIVDSDEFEEDSLDLEGFEGESDEDKELEKELGVKVGTRCTSLAGVDKCESCIRWGNSCSWSSRQPPQKGVPYAMWTNLGILFDHWVEWDRTQDRDGKLEAELEKNPAFMDGNWYTAHNSDKDWTWKQRGYRLEWLKEMLVRRLGGASGTGHTVFQPNTCMIVCDTDELPSMQEHGHILPNLLNGFNEGG
ncbi:hypothetical protein CALVIDRAFT_557025 [Calocera viscosa TUFC12733]|uniref:Uncharacterized protein n=1 Tax=Calocera viscosa (strain TUFC12733) TaxID=1330018 RepID=A0A167J8V6_CALVF|nr:hypothetical protein CALVIDRAFT_557025 [Calocera viscosa TUFC12733]